MALFDFLKKKKRQEKERAESRESSIVRDNVKKQKEQKGQEKTTPVFDEGRFHDDMVLVAPHITEKTRLMSERGAYVFRVIESATKQQVKRSVEHLYHVHAENIHIIHIPEKPRRRGLTSGSKKGYKKAVVSLRKGETIELF